MLATPHLLAGAAIASSSLPPEISLPLVFLSHFVLDAIPHIEPSTFLKKHRLKENEATRQEILWEIPDLALAGAILIFLYFKTHNFLLFWGAFAGISADLIDNVPFWYFVRKWPVFHQLHQFHDFFHYELDRKHWYWGIITQFSILVIALYFLV